MLKEICQKMIWENYYVNNFIYRLLPFSERRKMFKRISEMQSWDTIQDWSFVHRVQRWGIHIFMGFGIIYMRI